MDILQLALGQFQSFLICLARIGTLIAAMPVFMASPVPPQVRAGLAFMIALVVFPAVSPLLPQVSFAPGTLGLLLAKEAALGAMAGFVTRFVFSAVEIGGTVISYKMGFAQANIFDPQTQNQISVLPQFQNVLAMLVFLSLDIHHLLLRAMVQSYQLLPPGQMDFTGGAIPYLVSLSSAMFVLGIKLSAPVLAILILISVVMGVMARIFPQLNVFFLSWPINIGVSLVTLGITLSMFTSILARELHGLADRLIELMRLL